MNVWIESPFDNLPQEGYRPQRYWLMAGAFAEAGHSVVYWTGDFSHASKAARRLGHDVDGRIAELRFIPTDPYRRNVSLQRVFSHRSYAKRWKRLAIEAVEKGDLQPPDLIVASMPTISAAEVAVELGGKFGARTAVDVMDAWPETFYRLLPGFLRFLGPIVFKPLHRKAGKVYRKADFITGVCNRYGELVLGPGAENYHCAYHGIDFSSGVPTPRLPDGDVLRLVYAGNLGRTYDLGTVLEAVAVDGNTELDIAGAGPLEKKWKNMADGLGLGKRVRFHGYLGEDALAALMKECHLGVVPMSADSFVGLPYKLCDYVKSGLGVVSSLAGECEKFVLNYGAGVVYRAGDASSLVSAFDRWRDKVKAGNRPDFAGLTEKLDAKNIYRGYVKIF